MKLIITGILCLFFLSSSAQSTPEEKMKATTKKLLSYLASGDTIAIFKLYFVPDSLKQEKGYSESLSQAYSRFYDDSKTYQKIVNRHGNPDIKKIKINPGYIDFKELELNILDSPDTTLKISSSKIIITFYPAKYNLLDKIVNYSMLTYTTPLPENKKLIIAPSIIVPKSN